MEGIDTLRVNLTGSSQLDITIVAEIDAGIKVLPLLPMHWTSRQLLRSVQPGLADV